MIARLTGTLVDKQVQRIVIDVSGVGYEVYVPLSTFYAAGDIGARVALRIHTHVREDALQLFGFATALEQELFERLITVSGIGPKLALAVLSGIEPGELVKAVRAGDVARLTRTPGVGRKTAERLIVELKDRMPADGESEPSGPAATSASLRDDVLSALLNLGYQRQHVEKTLDRVLEHDESGDFEIVLRQILRELARA